jgi:hypothetical protein
MSDGFSAQFVPHRLLPFILVWGELYYRAEGVFCWCGTSPYYVAH